MGGRLVRKRAAERDLADHVERIAEEQPPAARRYLLAVERAFDRLTLKDIKRAADGSE